MWRHLGTRQVGRTPWLPLSERGKSEVLAQLLTQKEGEDLKSLSCMVPVYLSQACGILALI
jgi:hypothetical protein